MHGSWPINPNRITPRVCADLEWRVSARCPGCRHSYDLRLDKVADKPLAARPIIDLLKEGVFACRTRCAGLSANAVDVSAMDVGVSHYVARFRATDVSGARSVSVEGPAPD